MPRLGELPLFPIGLGCMPMSIGPGRGRGLTRETIHAALDAGVNLLDTADAYSAGQQDFGHNERVVARALAGRSLDGIAIATKGGHTRPGGRWEIDASPAYLRRACVRSLRALRVETIDLYQLHRPDPRVPFAESVGALRDLRDEGKIRHIGLSNVSVALLEEAERVAEIGAVQNELSLGYRAPLDNGELTACERRGIPFLAWSPLGGIGAAAAAAGRVAEVREIAERRGVSPQRVALAWLLSHSDSVVAIPGASRPDTILDSVAAATLRLEPAELARVTASATG